VPDNFVLPHNMKAFLFIATDDPLDADVVKTIQFLAKKRGWREYHAHLTDVSAESIGNVVRLTLHYLVPMEIK